MPTLYTSLIARQNPKLRTLAPKQQRTAVTPERAAKSVEALQATVADEHLGQLAEIVRVQASNKWIAVIGAGFAGLSAAYELRKRGYRVTIFEASDRAGYMESALQSGFRLARKLAARDQVPWTQTISPRPSPKRR